MKQHRAVHRKRCPLGGFRVAPGASALSLLVFFSLCNEHRSIVRAQMFRLPVAATAVPPPQSSVTSLQREIERQRARLAAGNVEERRDAVLRLGAIARPDSSRAALAALNDSSPLVRATATHSILFLPATEAATQLVPLLRDRDEFVRREAAYALGQTRSLIAVEPLVVALARDREAGVRGAAAVALGMMKDARAVPALAEALGRRIPRTGFFNRITFRKREENDFVRRASAVALGQIGSREAVPALVAVLANQRAGDDVRREAARALGLIGDPSAIPALRSALTMGDPYLSRIVIESLHQLDPAGAVPAVR